MKILKTVKAAQNFIKKTRKDKTIGFVPTMGYLHEGHLSLIRQARRDNDIVVVSIFVNPAQFSPREDLKRYPRNFKRDEVLAREAGADAIFYPSVKEIYPDGYKTYVEVSDNKVERASLMSAISGYSVVYRLYTGYNLYSCTPFSLTNLFF